MVTKGQLLAIVKTAVQELKMPKSSSVPLPELKRARADADDYNRSLARLKHSRNQAVITEEHWSQRSKKDSLAKSELQRAKAKVVKIDKQIESLQKVYIDEDSNTRLFASMVRSRKLRDESRSRLRNQKQKAEKEAAGKTLSPVDGQVAADTVPSSSRICNVIGTRKFVLEDQMEPDDALDLHVGQLVQIFKYGFSPASARISQLTKLKDDKPLATVVVENISGRLRLGDKVSMDFIGSGTERRFRIPKTALINRLSGNYLALIHLSRLHFIAVRVGRSFGDLVEILTVLPNDQVIDRTPANLKEGALVIGFDQKGPLPVRPPPSPSGAAT